SRQGQYTLIIISLYLFIYLLDSLYWPAFRTIDDKKIYKGSVTVLDMIYRPAKEESYSSPFSKYQLNENKMNKGFHPAGTNINGEDILKNALKGIKIAFTIGGLTTLIILPIGIFFGLIAGYYGKKIDIGVTYVYSTLISIPEILLLIALMNIFGNGILQLCVALGITSWVGLCRIVRAETIKQKNMEYVQAALALGHSHLKIIIKHILPNVMHIVLITTILRFSGLVMAEAVLSYLGLGVPPDMPSWGIMIDQARLELARDPVIWWNIGTAFFFMFILILSVNYFGDVVRDILDPRTRESKT
ncbi:MAG: ABC transporter permease, partial [Spirochaetes bacterium]|nr:ABC transporter permease [Spirochaetota bacterium]